ncbi:hypothetical protein MARI_08280 [Marinobacter sp. JH2]|nr:hypothetical protein MARI_08280 [Marinobacter sp. JH2]
MTLQKVRQFPVWSDVSRVMFDYWQNYAMAQ